MSQQASCASGTCLRCGYERTGLPASAPCPECSSLPPPREAVILRDTGESPRFGCANAVRLLSGLALLGLGALSLLFGGRIVVAAILAVFPLAIGAIFVHRAITGGRRRTPITVFFSVAGMFRPLGSLRVRTSWRDVRWVRARGSRIKARIGLVGSVRWSTGLSRDETSALAERINGLRERALAHPGASPPTRAFGRFQGCDRCGAMRELGGDARACPVCGEPESAGLRRVVLGRSSPSALVQAALWAVAIVAVLVTISVGMMWTARSPGTLIGPVLLVVSLPFLANLWLILRAGRLFLDAGWTVRDDRLDVLSSSAESVLHRNEMVSVACGPTVRDWTRVAVRLRDPSRPEVTIWIDARNDSAEDLRAALEATIAGGDAVAVTRPILENSDGTG